MITARPPIWLSDRCIGHTEEGYPILGPLHLGLSPDADEFHADRLPIVHGAPIGKTTETKHTPQGKANIKAALREYHARRKLLR